MIIITKDNFKEVINNNETVIIDFFASWCNPCLALGVILEEVSQNYPNVVVGKVNVDKEIELAQAFNISSIPFVVKYKNGKLVDSFLGLNSEEAVEEFFSK